jgi:hypothetical protein
VANHLQLIGILAATQHPDGRIEVDRLAAEPRLHPGAEHRVLARSSLAGCWNLTHRLVQLILSQGAQPLCLKRPHPVGRVMVWFGTGRDEQAIAIDLEYSHRPHQRMGTKPSQPLNILGANEDRAIRLERRQRLAKSLLAGSAVLD